MVWHEKNSLAVTCMVFDFRAAILSYVWTSATDQRNCESAPSVWSQIQGSVSDS